MTYLILLPFELFTGVKENIRGIFLHGKNKKCNIDELETFMSTMNETRTIMTDGHKWLSRLQHFNSPRRDYANNTYHHCINRINKINEKTEVIRKEADRVAGTIFPTLLNDEIDQARIPD